MILDIDDPDFLSVDRHFSVEQQVFCNLELAALLLLNTNIHLINEIPSYLTVVKTVVYDTIVSVFRGHLCYRGASLPIM